MLVIDGDTCIDCELCQEACPVNAIWPDSEIPDEYKEWIERNTELVDQGENITDQKDPLDGAKDLAQLQEEEQGKGWSIEEPSGA